MIGLKLTRPTDLTSTAIKITELITFNTFFSLIVQAF